MKFRSRDRRFGLELGEAELDLMRRLCAEAGRRETGGILVGRYTEARDVAVVRRVTSAPTDSRAGATWFHRGTRGLQALLDELWKEGDYYLGEWHYHPGVAPVPSPCDSDQLRTIASEDRYKCPEPILVIATLKGDVMSLGACAYPREDEPVEMHEAGPGEG